VLIKWNKKGRRSTRIRASFSAVSAALKTGAEKLEPPASCLQNGIFAYVKKVIIALLQPF
jgi:hypothetical protein